MNNNYHSLGEKFLFANYCDADDKKTDYLATPLHTSTISLIDVSGGKLTLFMEHDKDPSEINGCSGSGVFNEDGICVGFVYMTKDKL